MKSTDAMLVVHNISVDIGPSDPILKLRGVSSIDGYGEICINILNGM